MAFHDLLLWSHKNIVFSINIPIFLETMRIANLVCYKKASSLGIAVPSKGISYPYVL